MELLARVNPDHWLSILLIAVIIAPWVYRWRQRLRRWLIRLSLIAVGIGIGLSLAAT